MEKNRTLASFNKIPTNYISVQSLINNTILAMFSFSMCQEAVRRETTEGSSIEFIGYRIPRYEQNGCTVLGGVYMITARLPFQGEMKSCTVFT